MSLALPEAAFAPLLQRARSDMPSGQAVDLFEVLIDDVGGEAWLRFRFLAPAIGKAGDNVTYAEAQADFAHLCNLVALPYLAEFDLQADVIVIALLDRPVEFGASDPDATQYIEAFRTEAGSCAWEAEW